MQQLEQPSSNVPCNCVQFWAAYAIRGAGFGNCVKTRLYCCSPRLICMHWVQIKQNCRTAYCQKPPFLALARIYCRILPYIALYCRILPYIAVYCRILPYITIYCYQRQVKDCTKSSKNRLPFSCSYLFSNCKIHLCHHSFLCQGCQPMLRHICPLFDPIIISNLFHIIFTGSFYVSLYIIFTMKK